MIAMDDIFAILNQPFILTLLSLTLGGYLFRLLSDHRARKETIRDKAIEFLTEVGENINSVISKLFWHINNEKPHVWKNEGLKKEIGELISNRMGVQVKSEAYLKNSDFYEKYVYLVWELYFVRGTIGELINEYDLDQIMVRIRQRKEKLNETIPLEDEVLIQRGNQPYNEIASWTQMILNRAATLLSSHLKATLK